jgi:hypothetical protein
VIGGVWSSEFGNGIRRDRDECAALSWKRRCGEGT